MKRIIFILVILSLLTSIYAITPEEIIRLMELNQVHDTAEATGKMVVTDRFGTRTSTFKSYSKGASDSLIEFTSIEEAGQKILRTKNEIYLFFPDAEELIRIQGAALRDSVLGSDFSYEDMTGDKGILDLYNVTLEGSENVEGEDCYKIRLEAKDKGVPYALEYMWVDKKLFIYRKVHRFSKSGKLLKEMFVSRIETIKGKTIPMQMVMTDKLKKDSKTEFIIENLKIDIKLDSSLFSLEELTW